MMIQFPRPASLNGSQLLAELATGGVIATDPTIDGNGDFWLEMAEVDAAAADIIVADHIAAPPIEPTITEKLESIGLTIPDLRAALGL